MVTAPPGTTTFESGWWWLMNDIDPRRPKYFGFTPDGLEASSPDTGEEYLG